MTTSKDQVERLQGQKVILREKQLADVENDYTWSSDRELMRLDAAEPCQVPFSLYAARYAEGLRDPTRKQFAVETPEREHIGNCVCYNIDTARKEAEIGILIGNRDYWDQGYGSDAVRTLMEYAFDRLGLERIYLHTLEWNIRAQECFERCGFTSNGRIISKGLEFVKMEALAPGADESGDSP